MQWSISLFYLLYYFVHRAISLETCYSLTYFISLVLYCFNEKIGEIEIKPIVYLILLY